MLETCEVLWGSAEIIDSDPLSTAVLDGLYLPYEAGAKWGIFDKNGVIVRSATDFREKVKLSHLQLIDPINGEAYLSQPIRQDALIYGGYINLHYGHFIVNSLPRLWNIARIKTPTTKILCHSACSPKDWFLFPFIASIMGALGLRPDDFVSPTHPVRLHSLIVPETSLHEQSAAHRIYGTFCRDIGRRLVHGRQSVKKGDLVYFSKTRLKSAVGLIENEIEIEKKLRSLGVDIIYPETLPLRDQIGVFLDYDRILGSSGSFMHTSIFAERANIFCLNVTAQINTNYTIIDALAGNEAYYFYPPAIKVAENRAGVMTARYLPDAPAVAEELFLKAAQ